MSDDEPAPGSRSATDDDPADDRGAATDDGEGSDHPPFVASPADLQSGNDAAVAFVPAHVTGFFSVAEGEDPMETGSRGGGLTLADGVTVAVSRGERQTYLDGVSTTVEPVETVLDALGATDATVVIESDVPLGCGFGVSGAAALGTALATAARHERDLTENELVSLAHGAEVSAGTGLGDVVAQARGGAVLRVEAGAPGRGSLDGVPMRSAVEYLVLDGRSTSDVLAGDTTLLTEVGDRALQRVRQDPTAEQFVRSSRFFAREAELLTPELRDVVQSVNEAGGDAAVAMLGETVFSLGTGLTDAGYDAERTAIDPCGATLLE